MNKMMLPETYSQESWSSRFGSRVLESSSNSWWCGNTIHGVSFELSFCVLAVLLNLIRWTVVSWLLILCKSCAQHLSLVSSGNHEGRYMKLHRKRFDSCQTRCWKIEISARWVSVKEWASHPSLSFTVKAPNLQSLFLTLQRETGGYLCCF